MTSNSNLPKAIPLSGAELDAATGGLTSSIVGLSVDNQNAIALAQELSAAYLKSHPIHLGPFH